MFFFYFCCILYIVRIRNLSILIVLLIPIVSKGQGQGPPAIMNQKEINSSASPHVLHARKKHVDVMECAKLDK